MSRKSLMRAVTVYLTESRPVMMETQLVVTGAALRVRLKRAISATTLYHRPALISTSVKRGHVHTVAFASMNQAAISVIALVRTIRDQPVMTWSMMRQPWLSAVVALRQSVMGIATFSTTSRAATSTEAIAAARPVRTQRSCAAVMCMRQALRSVNRISTV